jgi:apolipoprotein N-acyltransferase
MRLTTRQAFAYHFAAGIGYNVLMYWWIYNVMKVGPALVIGLGLVVLILFLSLFNGILGWLFRVLAGTRGGLFAFPFMWGGLEVLRTEGEMSFPWNDMGYALGHWLPLIQSASWMGIFGLSIAVVACNCLAFAAWRAYGSRRYVLAGCAAAIPAFLAVQGSLALAGGSPAANDSADIALVQPSIEQTKKWDEDYFREVMRKTWVTMEGEPRDSMRLQGADLIVLAETAVPDFLRSRPELHDEFRQLAKRTGADVMVGALDYVADDKPWRKHIFYNSAFLFPGAPGHEEMLQYSKLRLVPFSERLPFDDVFPVINYVNLGEGDFSPGLDYAIWDRKAKYAPSICYEIIYPDFVRGARKRGARYLVNITNDGWFGVSNAPFMHANISKFRAVEAGMPIARCSNAGISVFYDAYGRELSKSKLNQEIVLRRKLPLATRETGYLKAGDWIEGSLMWFFVLGFAGCWGLAWRMNRRAA